MTVMHADVGIVGGGPAGLTLALLLVRRGLRVVVLEKHDSFLRDFRGDTVHPSTLMLLDELGLGDRMHRLPHRKVRRLRVSFVGDGSYRVADFGRLHVAHPYLMFVPQSDFLELMSAAASEYPGFTLLRSHEVTDLLREDGRVAGVVARAPDGRVEVRARLTVAADGRHSVVRQRLGLSPKEYGAPMDVLWFRLPRRNSDGEGLDMRVGAGRLMLGIDRGDYWQCAFVIKKGGYQQVVAAGLPAFRAAIARLAPPLADRVDRLSTWEDVKVLTVRVDRLPRWHAPGVLLIGDAAHAMSPVGGVGINLAVQDAVAAARLLAEPLRSRRLTEQDLERVRRRRRLPTAGTQLIQRALQRGVLGPLLATERPVRPPLPLRLLDRIPPAQALPARVIGIGLRPEHAYIGLPPEKSVL